MEHGTLSFYQVSSLVQKLEAEPGTEPWAGVEPEKK